MKVETSEILKHFKDRLKLKSYPYINLVEAVCTLKIAIEEVEKKSLNLPPPPVEHLTEQEKKEGAQRISKQSKLKL